MPTTRSGNRELLGVMLLFLTKLQCSPHNLNLDKVVTTSLHVSDQVVQG